MAEPRVPVVVVGVDGSESSKQALRWAARHAEVTGAQLMPVTAWHLPELYAYATRDYEVDAANMLDGVLKEVLDPASTVPVTPRIVQGRAAPVLIAASEEADLLVLGARGHGAFTGMLLGSVSQHCVQHSACPVVVIPPPKE